MNDIRKVVSHQIKWIGDRGWHFVSILFTGKTHAVTGSGPNYPEAIASARNLAFGKKRKLWNWREAARRLFSFIHAPKRTGSWNWFVEARKDT